MSFGGMDPSHASGVRVSDDSDEDPDVPTTTVQAIGEETDGKCEFRLMGNPRSSNGRESPWHDWKLLMEAKFGVAGCLEELHTSESPTAAV